MALAFCDGKCTNYLHSLVKIAIIFKTYRFVKKNVYLCRKRYSSSDLKSWQKHKTIKKGKGRGY